MASLAQDEFDIFAAEQLRRTVTCAPWRNVVGCPAQNEQIARHLGQIKRMSCNVERTRRSISIGLKQLQKVAHQRR